MNYDLLDFYVISNNNQISKTMYYSIILNIMLRSI